MPAMPVSAFSIGRQYWTPRPAVALPSDAIFPDQISAWHSTFSNRIEQARSTDGRKASLDGRLTIPPWEKVPSEDSVKDAAVCGIDLHDISRLPQTIAFFPDNTLNSSDFLACFPACMASRLQIERRPWLMQVNTRRHFWTIKVAQQLESRKCKLAVHRGKQFLALRSRPWTASMAGGRSVTTRQRRCRGKSCNHWWTLQLRRRAR